MNASFDLHAWDAMAIQVKDGKTALLPDLWSQVEGYVRHKARVRVAALHGELNGNTVDDLVQVGFFALLAAVETYRPEVAAFMTHLKWKLLSEFYRATRKKCKDPINCAFSLDAPIGDAESSCLGSVIEDIDNEISHADRLIWSGQVRPVLNQIIRKLPLRQQEVLNRRFKLEQSVTIIAKEMGITPSAASHLLGRALQTLRQYMEVFEE